MLGYAIFYRRKTLKREELETYWRDVKATSEGYDMEIIVNHGRHESVEGESYEGIVIAKFQSYELAQSWYRSDLYQKVAKHRHDGAVYQVVLVEGL